jgi:hypothetical protein
MLAGPGNPRDRGSRVRVPFSWQTPAKSRNLMAMYGVQGDCDGRVSGAEDLGGGFTLPAVEQLLHFSVIVDRLGEQLCLLGRHNAV